VSVHCSGDYINPGFRGALPLQLDNHNPFAVILYPYMSICQLALYQLSSEPLAPYGQRSDTRYHREEEASPSVLHTDPAVTGQSKVTLEDEAHRRLIEVYLEERKRPTQLVPAVTAAPGLPLSPSHLTGQTPELLLSPPPSTGQGTQVVFQNATVGVLNAGTIKGNIGVGLDELAGNAAANAVVEALRSLVQVVEEHRGELGDTAATQTLEQIEEVTNEATKPEEERSKPGAIQAYLSAMEKTVTALATGAALWDKVEPVLKHWFQLP